MALASYEAVTSPFEVVASALSPASVDEVLLGSVPESAERPSGTAQAKLVGGLPERLRHVALVSLDQRCSAFPGRSPQAGRD